MRTIQVERYGGPEVLVVREVPEPVPGPGQALVRIEAVGVNFIDVYHRTGRYPIPTPFVPGQEGAGVVVALGEGAGAAGIAVGDRVAWANQLGSYAELALVPVAKLVPVPAELPPELAAAAMLQGITAHYLVTDTFPLRPGHTALVHAGAGGVGLLLTQMAKRRGARVIATVSSDEKAALSREAGADHVVVYTREDFRDEVRRLTDGRGVDVVFDSAGKSTFDRSLESLRPRGMLVLFGASSGPVPPVDPMRLNQGSFYLTRPTVGHYVATREELLARAGDVLGQVRSGALRVRIGARHPLVEARRAHRELEARATTGKVLLVP
ncbi:MAG TPA: quinone oxidoreductase [Gemmatimonadales bacterium]|nr:quinone oxidoreductase [Gemmatimonadales bacterium]